MANEKISAMSTLANPPTVPVFDAVITNDGTTATNFQRPQGQIVQSTVAGTVAGQGITLNAASAVNTSGGYATGADVLIQGGYATADAGHGAYPGFLQFNAGYASSGTRQAAPLVFRALPPAIYTSNIVGGGVLISGARLINDGTGDVGAYINITSGTATSGTCGPISLLGGSAGGTLGVGGSVTVGPGTGGGGNGILLVPNIGTVDPHVLNAKWQKSVAGVGYVGVYSKG